MAAVERYPRLTQDELAYSSPLSISAADAARVRELLVAAVAAANQIRDASPCEQLYCLNVDWAKVD